MQNFQHDLKYKIIVECKKYTKWKCKIRFPGETVVGYTHIYLHPKVQLGNNTEWSAIIYSGIVPTSTWRLVGWSSPSWSPSPLPSSFTDTRRRPPTGWTFSGNFKLQVWKRLSSFNKSIRVKNGFYLIVGIIDIGSFPILTLIVSGLIEPFSISHSLFLMNCQKIIEILTKATSISPLLLGLIDDRYWFSIPQWFLGNLSDAKKSPKNLVNHSVTN